MSVNIIFSTDTSETHRYLKNNEYHKVDFDSSLSSLFSDISSPALQNTPTLSTVFPGLRYIDSSVIIFERPPRYENIFLTLSLVDNINSDSITNTYRIPIPWQVYVIEYNRTNNRMYACDVRMFFSNKSINFMQDEVYLPPLSNFYADSSLCRPTYLELEDIDRYPNTINGVIQEAYDWIWNSGTNLDLTVTPLHYLRTAFYNTDFKNSSILSNLSKVYTSYCSNFHSFYAPTEPVSAMFDSWSKLTLSEVCNLRWLYPMTPSFKNSFVSSMNSRLDSIQSQYSSFSYESASCCEECQYYDEDGEPVSGECVEEGHCSCHETSYDYASMFIALIEQDAFNLYDHPMTLLYYYNNLINPQLRNNSFSRDILMDKLNYYSS